MIVRLSVTVAHACRRVAAHAAAACRVVPIIAGAGGEDLAIAGLSQLLKKLLEMFVRECLARLGGGIGLVLDRRHGIAPTVTRSVIECEAAVAIGLHIVVAAHPRGAPFRALAPVRQQSVAQEQTPASRTQPRLVTGRALPNPQVVADERSIRLTAEIEP